MSSPAVKNLFAAAITVLIVWFGAKYLLPILMPFLLAALLALASEPLVRSFSRGKLSRSAAAGIGVSLTLAILILLVTVVGALAVRQLQSLAGAMPDLESTALQGMNSLRGWLAHLASSAPAGIRSLATRSVDELFSDGTDLVSQLSAQLPALASGIMSRLPDSALSIGTWLLASFMLSARLPKLRCWISAHAPASWKSQWLPTLKRLKRSVLGWLTAQLKLMSVTFAVLTAGFLLLRVGYAPLWGFLISLVDALPVLGTGTVLVPWSAVCFIQGDTVRGIGLLGVYAVAVLLRSVLEPKLVGRQLGLDPLVTLLAMYTGYRLWGILGMILSPLIAVTAVQLFSPQPETD